MLFHPRISVLVRFAAGECGPAHVLRRHLETCPRCRGVVSRAREVSVAAAAMPTPAFDTERLWQRIETRRDEHVLLPTGALPAPRRWTRSWHAVAAAASLVGAAYLVWPGDNTLQAGASYGTLIVDTLAVQPGRSVPVRYTPASRLASAESLVVRGTFFGEQPRSRPVEGTAVLRREASGLFGGALALPSALHVASLVVASPDGKYVDDNAGQPWEIVARDTAGRPLQAALDTWYVVRDREDWEKGYRIAKLMAHHYPDNPRGWRFDAYNEMALAGKVGIDSVRRAYHPRLVRLHELLRDQPSTSSQLWEMTMLAEQLGDTARTQFWRGRLMREFPMSTAAAQFRVWDIAAAEPDLRRRLARFDALYEQVGGESLQLVYDAFGDAITLGDSAAVARWGRRVMEGRPENSWWVGSEFAKVSGLRAEGLAMLRRVIREGRPLTSTDWPAAYARGIAKGQGDLQLQGMLQSHALGLLRAGQGVAAYDTIARAAALGRNPRLTHTLVEAALAIGDSGAAARAWAWMSADPKPQQAALDSLARRLGRHVTTPQIERWRADASRAYTEDLLATSFRRPLGNALRVRDERGREVVLDAQIQKSPIIVAFVSRWCAPSAEDLRSLAEMTVRLRAKGIAVYAVSAEQPTVPVKAAYARRGWTEPLYYDDAAHARRALRSTGTPAYFVIAPDSTARFLARQAVDLIGMTEALR